MDLSSFAQRGVDGTATEVMKPTFSAVSCHKAGDVISARSVTIIQSYNPAPVRKKAGRAIRLLPPPPPHLPQMPRRGNE